MAAVNGVEGVEEVQGATTMEVEGKAGAVVIGVIVVGSTTIGMMATIPAEAVTEEVLVGILHKESHVKKTGSLKKKSWQRR